MEQHAWRSLLESTSRLARSELRLVDDLLSAAVRYAELRARWRLAASDERPKIEPDRTRAHNLFIDACNALSRACVRAAVPIDWRSVWGEARAGEARKRIGDFACFIAYQLMLEAR